MTDQVSITSNLQSVRELIKREALACQRDPNDILLLAVSKTKPVSDIILAYQSGQRAFGENYVQEGVEKIHAMLDFSDVSWHFIGPLQSNKSKLVAENFDWVHSVDRFKIAKRLSDQRTSDKTPLNICIQINIDRDPNKSGVAPENALQLLRDVAQLQNLCVRGLMTIPKQHEDTTVLEDSFKEMQDIFYTAKQEFASIDTLSMGMSGDMALAIKYGSTMVRIGTAIFGARTTNHKKNTNAV